MFKNLAPNWTCFVAYGSFFFHHREAQGSHRNIFRKSQSMCLSYLLFEKINIVHKHQCFGYINYIYFNIYYVSVSSVSVALVPHC